MLTKSINYQINFKYQAKVKPAGVILVIKNEGDTHAFLFENCMLSVVVSLR